MYKIKKSFPFVLVCGSLCGPVRRHLCFILSPGVVLAARSRFFAILHSLHFLNRIPGFSRDGKSTMTPYFTTNASSSELSKCARSEKIFPFTLINYRPYLLTAQSRSAYVRSTMSYVRKLCPSIFVAGKNCDIYITGNINLANSPHDLSFETNFIRETRI